MAKPRGCIISSEVVGPFKNGGIGTHCYYLAQFLSRELHWDIPFLYTGPIETHDEAYWEQWFRRELDIRFVQLPAAAPAASGRLGLACEEAQVAQGVFQWLRQQTFEV